jgi:hypothetical protein
MCSFKSSWRVEVVLGALVVWWFAPWRVGRRRLFHADAVGMVGRHWCSGGEDGDVPENVSITIHDCSDFLNWSEYILYI